MRKSLFTLLVLFVLGLSSAVAQNYEVIYSMKMNPNAIVNMIAAQTGMPEDMMVFLKDDIKKARLMVSLNVSKDKSRMKFLKDQSKFEINMMGMKMDGAAMFDNAGINTFTDYTTKQSLTIISIDGKTYVVDGEYSDKKFSNTNEKKTILGHQCIKMKDTNSDMVVWYATDIPYQTKMFPGVPGLVLEMLDSTGYFTFTATSYKKTATPVQLPKNVKKVTKEQVDEMLENAH